MTAKHLPGKLVPGTEHELKEVQKLVAREEPLLVLNFGFYALHPLRAIRDRSLVIRTQAYGRKPMQRARKQTNTKSIPRCQLAPSLRRPWMDLM
jgi:hypothetical protein